MGTLVRDGDFEFDVKAFDCGAKSVGSDMLGAKAQGQFCIAKVKVTNIGDKSQIFDDSSQVALAGTKEYDADGEAGLYANKDGEAFLEKINPGNSVTANIVFDVPKNVTVDALELHDSPFSDGVTIAVK